MKNFEYATPTTEAEVLELLAPDAGSVEVLAGGTDLVGLMKKMIVNPDRVVNVMEVPSLKTIEQLDGGVVAIGATVTLDVLLTHPYLDPYPAVRQAIRGIASMTLQCQGTLGGEILQRPQCWFYRGGHGLLGGGGRDVEEGDNRYHAIFGNSGAAKFVSSSRIAPALVALGATARVIGPQPDGEQLVPIETLYRIPRHEGERETSLLPGQIVTHFLLPPSQDVASATYEVRHGEGPDYPLASAAAAIRFDGGFVADAKIVLGQVAPTPWISHEAADAIIGHSLNEETADAAGQAAVAAARPLSMNGYKVQLAKTAVKRALLLAAGMETGGF
ncbi:MAG TPA: FAD binding domain-containing protein [Pirellulaceae bacterium]|nr:FAD binding domain-containing protein [Pirellulaceae bacterium]